MSIEMSRHVRFRPSSAYTEVPICDFRETGAIDRKATSGTQSAGVNNSSSRQRNLKD